MAATDTTTQIIDGTPTAHLRHVLKADMLRLEIEGRVKKLVDEYRATYHGEPLWVRLSFDLVHRAGPPAFIEGCQICGLGFHLDLTSKDTVEVGSSCWDKK